MESPKKVRKPAVRYDTDKAVLNVFHRLLSDFRSVHENFRKDVVLSELKDVTALRSQVSDYDYSSCHPARFKSHAQLQTLFKKYRFANDVYTDAEIAASTFEKYLKVQSDLNRVCMTGLVQTRVLSRARYHARRILGEFQEDDIIPFLRFGAKASIGCPLRLAHIDVKLSDVKAFTGSSQIGAWFQESVLAKDPILERMLNRIHPTRGRSHVLTEKLILQLVPKAFDKLRPITPLPLLDLYYSNGIGGLIQEKLTQEGLDITKLQARHARFIRISSINRKHATADLSAASDTITSPLLNRVLPRAWYTAIKKLFFRTMEYEGKDFHTLSVLPMGNGATFVLETLVFYCVLRALGDLSGVDGKISVYGDDLIYPSRLHKYVAWVFPKLGFKLNLDKTFVRSRFRESCGADFYHGADVRPFYLKGEHSLLTRSQYGVWLYKLYNGLRRRWEEVEIPSTLSWILYELADTVGTILRVPMSFPDTAGLHTDFPREIPMGIRMLPLQPITTTYEGATKYAFSYMSQTAGKRFVRHVEPYYWLRLQGRDDEANETYVSRVIFDWKRDAYVHGSCHDEAQISQLTWRRFWKRSYRFLKGRRVKVKVPCYKAMSSEKLITRTKRKTGSTFAWV